jgi:hypothetical protein
MTQIKARPTLYKGIQMRSRLEADYAAYLDRTGGDWDYEPECFAGPRGQWLPDFRRNFPETGGTYVEYVEVKPLKPLMDAMETGNYEPIENILQRMTQAWWSNRDAILVLDFWEYGTAEPTVEFVGSISEYSNHGWRLRSPRFLGDSERIWPGCLPEEAEEWRKEAP